MSNSQADRLAEQIKQHSRKYCYEALKTVGARNEVISDAEDAALFNFNAAVDALAALAKQQATRGHMGSTPWGEIDDGPDDVALCAAQPSAPQADHFPDSGKLVREQAALTPTGPCEGCDLPNGCPEYCHCGEPPAFIAQGTTPAAGVGDARKLTADQERHVFLAAHGDMRDQPRLTSQDAAWIGWQSRGALAKGIAFVLPEELD